MAQIIHTTLSYTVWFSCLFTTALKFNCMWNFFRGYFVAEFTGILSGSISYVFIVNYVEIRHFIFESMTLGSLE